ncbi:class I SAM-dependent methyltransferase [Epibacterium ulvae]|uniref:class I SAM-dependent methyltransferase n=1 Tax=Epibacterium ulvae TaxID=1156985 RepID=UPI002491F822|nr:class I SAM-dependent methyltransferase [Epibacterium ulvae]
MGKRSNFERIPRDFYPTPEAAIAPLVPHLPCGDFYYAEPCAGDGALIQGLSAQHLGARCSFLADISPSTGVGDVMGVRNALELTDDDLDGCDWIITNPPWERKTLHAMIDHFSALRPTWLLFDADWVHTKQAAPYLPWLRKVVSVGRVKWIKDSPHTGKDNCAWHLFDRNGLGPAEFHGRVQ